MIQWGLLWLTATLAMLVAGPLLVEATHDRPRPARIAERFVQACIAALVALEVAPEAVRAGGWVSLAFLLAGLFGPTLLERGARSARRAAHLGALALALLGLVLHALGDGAVIAAATDRALPVAVALHTLPVAMAVWLLLEPPFGWRPASAVLAGMALGTLAGFSFGISLSEMLGARSWAWAQALVAGSILHVVFGRPHLDGHDHG